MIRKNYLILVLNLFLLNFTVFSSDIKDEEEKNTPNQIPSGPSGFLNINEEIENNFFLSDENKIITDHEFLEWFKVDVLQSPSLSQSQKIGGGVAKASGYLSGFTFFKLAFDFGDRLLQDADPLVRVGLSGLYASCAYIPIAVLGSNLSSYVFQDLLKKDSDQKKLIIQKDIKSLDKNKVFKFLATSAGIISAPPMTYLAYTSLYDWFKEGSLVSAIPMFYVKTAIDIWSITSLSEVIYNQISSYRRPNLIEGLVSRQDKIRIVIGKLEQISNKISNLTQDEASSLLKAVGIASQNQDNDNEIFNKFNNLLNPELFLKKELTYFSPDLGKKLFKVFGGCVGAFGMACVEPLAEAALIPLLVWTGIPSHSFIKPTLGWVSTVTASSLMAWGTSDSFGKLYDASKYVGKELYFKVKGYSSINDSESIKIPITKRAAIGIASSLLAGAACGMQAEISLNFLGDQSIYAIAALICSVSSTWATNFWAVDHHLMTLYSSYDSRIILQSKIKTIIDIIPYLSSKRLDDIEKLI